MKKIFLTGGAGNVGRYVVRELLSRQCEVTVLVHRNTSVEGCRTVQAALSEAGKYAAEAAVADGIIHIASTRSVERGPVVKEDIYGTGLLLDSWRKGNFVYMSSQSVYGVPRGPLTEDHPFDPVCWYDIAKINCEQQLAIEPARPGRGVGVALRMALLFGPGGHGRGDQFLESLYPHCAAGNIFGFKTEEALETAGSSFVGPEDLARALADSLDLGAGGPYNISSGYCSFRELLDGLCKRIGTAPRYGVISKLPAGAKYVPMPQSRSFVDSSKFSKAAGYAPRQDLDGLLDAFVGSVKGR